MCAALLENCADRSLSVNNFPEIKFVFISVVSCTDTYNWGDGGTYLGGLKRHGHVLWIDTFVSVTPYIWTNVPV